MSAPSCATSSRASASQSIALVGYSMGGNLVLKLAGELGADAPRQLRSVVGVSPAIDLGPSAAALHRPHNRLYERRFLRALLPALPPQGALFPRAYDPNRAHRHPLPARLRRPHHRASTPASPPPRTTTSAPPPRASSTASPSPRSSSHALDDPFIRITPETLAALARQPAHHSAPARTRRPLRLSCRRPTPPQATTATGPRPPCSASSSPTRDSFSRQRPPEIIEPCLPSGPPSAPPRTPSSSFPGRTPSGRAAFVDLRANPYDFDAIPEAEQHPPLMQALRALNATRSPVFTAKCDAWPLDAEELAHLHTQSRRSCADRPRAAGFAHPPHGFASYIDLVWRERSLFTSFPQQERILAPSHPPRRPLDHPRPRSIACCAPRSSTSKARARAIAISLYVKALGLDPHSRRTGVGRCPRRRRRAAPQQRPLAAEQ